MKRYLILAVIAAAAAIAAGCGIAKNQIMDGDGMVNSTYQQISQEEAKEMMSRNDGHIIVDVRRQDEYDEGHIPGAICIPNESIDDKMPAELPDTGQTILVYCRSGRRSKEASKKLADIGYTNVYEFGGIIDWTGETVSENKADTTTSVVSEPEYYAMDPMPIMVCDINGKQYGVSIADNDTAKEWVAKLSSGPLELDMLDYGGFEKVAELPFTLTTNDEQITTSPRDITLYQGNKLSIYYDENTWELTRLGTIDMTEEELEELKNADELHAEFTVEWTE